MALVDQSIYERDFAAWVESQIALIHAGEFGRLDHEHVAEELEGLAARDRRELKQRLRTVFEHMLKLEVEPDSPAARGWRLTIREQWRCIHDLVFESPSLRKFAEHYAEEAYDDARQDAAESLNRPMGDFPRESPWPFKKFIPPSE